MGWEGFADGGGDGGREVGRVGDGDGDGEGSGGYGYVQVNECSWADLPVGGEQVHGRQ